MTTLDEFDLFDAPTPPAHAARPCRHPRARRDRIDGVLLCTSCGHAFDEAIRRRGKRSRRLGGDQERRIERVYGPTKVGEFGDAIDHLGRDFKWQSKATRDLPPAWLSAVTGVTWRPIVPVSVLDPLAHMAGLGGARVPLVIRSYVRQGVRTRDWLFMPSLPWAALHGPPGELGYIVVPGEVFLEIHGRDEQ